ncbi:MAG TPA: pantetheine-phosphate adenylyltransferase [Planctomycetes bacterium]|nr:pantetheine-phosphate adenylyltransferase [Planctomycetota bacterium]
MTGPAIYPGTFDPPHRGHIDLIERGVRLFGELVVAVAVNRDKQTIFTPEERIGWLESCTADLEGVRVMRFTGLVVNLLARQDSRILLRGIRTFADFEAEYTMALTNRSISTEFEAETVFVMPALELSHYSSRHVKEIASFGGDVRSYLPEEIAEQVSSRLTELLGPGTVESTEGPR